MSAATIIFYIIAAFILVTGILAVTTQKIFRSAIWLLLSLIGIAAFYFWLEMEFIAAVQIVLYVGGIVVLIIFSIFLTQQSSLVMPRQTTRRVVAATLAAVFGFGLVYLQIWDHGFESFNHKFEWSMNSIGSSMLSTGEGGFALPFEAVSVLLLAAMIGCIVIAMKSPSKEEEPKNE
jgi:NADH-quinone oxidoreductase subunit J